METSIKKLPKSKIEIEISISSLEFDEYYKKAIDLSPNNVQAYNNLAVVYKNMGDLQNAEKMF